MFKGQHPPQIKEAQQKEQSSLQTENTIDEPQQSNSQQFQQNETHSRFHKGPQPLMVRFIDSPYK